MYKRKKVLNPQIVLEFLCFAAFAVLIFYLIKSEKYQHYVAPKMVPYLYFTAVVMTLWALAALFRVFRPQYKTHSAHCLILAIPIMLLLLPHSSVSASNLSSGYLNGNAIAGTGTLSSAPAAKSKSPDSQSTQADNPSDSQGTEEDKSPDSQSTQEDSVPKDEYGNDLVGLDIKNKQITVENDYFYTWINEIYTNLDKYAGYQITVTGFVFKDPETMKSNEFSPARLMMSCCVADLTPVGFICKYDEAPNLTNDSWVTVTGTIMKGEYMGDPEPQISVAKISPADEVEGYVYP
ncbi:MAG TPA: TIGR03943 family protein [Bacillota bacterium]|nr:TIGR03943 family protein [Bacillota bacterium]